MVPWLALFVVVPLLFAAAARGARWAPLILVVIAAGDQGYWGFQYVFGNPNRPLMTMAAVSTFAPAPESAKPGDVIDARPGVFPFQNALILRGFRVWRGYLGLQPVLQLPNTDTTAQLAGAKWRSTNPGFTPVPSSIDRARLLTKARVSSNVAADVSGINVLDEALVDQPIEELSGPPGTVKVLDDRPGQIVVGTSASGRQLLVLTERYDPGWQVEGARPLLVYGDFLGCVVEAGTHRVAFRFRPQSFRYGLISTALGLLLVLCVIPFAFVGTPQK
jgi:hypothetical protein